MSPRLNTSPSRHTCLVPDLSSDRQQYHTFPPAVWLSGRAETGAWVTTPASVSPTHSQLPSSRNFLPPLPSSPFSLFLSPLSFSLSSFLISSSFTTTLGFFFSFVSVLLPQNCFVIHTVPVYAMTCALQNVCSFFSLIEVFHIYEVTVVKPSHHLGDAGNMAV